MTTPPAPTYCSNHPSVETSLRCIQCNRYICAKCAVRTPTGYRCRDCVRSHQAAFDNATTRDYLIVFFLGGFLSFIGSVATMLITSVIWGFVIIALAPTAGVLIGNLLRRIIKGHHAKALNWTLVAAVVLGGLPLVALSLLPGLFLLFMNTQLDPTSSISYLGTVVWQIVYLALAAPAAYAQFAGIRLVR